MYIINEPAMIIENKNEKYILIGDLHLGLTSDLRRKGVSIHSQVDSFVNHLRELKNKTKSKNLIMIGDVKHEVRGISWQEEKEIPLFLNKLSKIFKKIIIIKGNHDGFIEKLVPKALKKTVKIKKDMSLGSYFITHGHRNAKTKKKYIITGHNQPSVKLIDRIGASYTLPCWVIGKIKKTDQELIIMPAFNPLAGSGIVNQDKFMGPIAKKIDIENSHVYLLDGTDLGTINDLIIKH